MWRQIKKDGHWLKVEDVQRLRMDNGTEHIRYEKQHGALRGSVKGRGWGCSWKGRWGLGFFANNCAGLLC